MTIYLIFSQEGFEEAKSQIITEQAVLWVNQDFLSDEQVNELTNAKISLNTFNDFVDGANDKSIIAALEPIEKEVGAKTEILVEYLS